MKISQRILSLLLSASTISALTACSSSDGNTPATESTTITTTAPKVLDETDAQAVQEIDTGNSDKLENGTVKWLSFWDLNPASGKPKTVELELFETKYGGKIQHIPTTYENRFNDLSTLVLGGDSPDLFPAADLDTFPGKVIAGMFEPFDGYLDFESDLWTDGAKQLSDRHMLNGQHYVAVTATDAGCVFIYNKKTIEENGLEDPAELLEKNEWTWDAFNRLSLEFADREKERYAYDGWWFEINFLLTTGVPVVSVENGKIVSNLLSKEMERAENFMYELKKNDLPLPLNEYGWSVMPNRISEGKTLFYPCGIWALYEEDLSAYGEMDEIMFVPMPRDPSADAYYLPAGLSAFALCKDAPNPEGAAAYINCALVAVKDETANEIAVKQYREDYGWTDEMLAMWNKTKELTNANPVIDFYAGVSPDLHSLVHDPIKQVTYSGTEWYVTREAIYEAAQYEIDQQNKMIESKFN